MPRGGAHPWFTQGAKRHGLKPGTSWCGRTQCTAKAKWSGKRCKYVAEPGKDKCRFHGGRTTVTHGRYSKYISTKLGRALLEQDGHRDLSEELRLCRACVARGLELVGKMKTNGAELAALTVIQSLVSEVRKVAKALAAIEQARSITPEQVNIVIHNLIRVLGEHVEPKTLALVAADLKEMPWPSQTSVLPEEVVA